MKFIIFNWKSYLGIDDSSLLVKFISKTKFINKFKIILAPSSLSLGLLKHKYSNVTFSAQNFDEYGKGGFTSFLAISDLKENDINYSLVGHSEVRQYRKENDHIVNQKVKIAVDNRITPIVCIGENLLIYKKNILKIILENNLMKYLTKKYTIILFLLPMSLYGL